MRIAWLTDSSIYIPEHGNFNDVFIIPMQISFGESNYRDGVDISSKEFYSMLASSNEIPKSSQPAVGDIEHTLKMIEASYDAIIGVFISKKISGTFDSIKAATGNVAIPFYMVDSEIVSWPLYDLIETGKKMIREGKSIEETIEHIEKLPPTYHNTIYVASLDQLLKGGRIGKVGFAIGSILQIKPILQFINGKLEVFQKVRTKKKSFQVIANQFIPSAEAAWVLHCGDVVNAEYMKQLLLEKHPKQTIRIGELSPIIAIHGGQGSLAVVSKQKQA
ncbi:DegV family protein [Paenisporosarcina cavernae]|nr:DegV family protein [Paenisporosarcina cavernae]